MKLNKEKMLNPVLPDSAFIPFKVTSTAFQLSPYKLQD